MEARISATEAALAELSRLREQFGSLILFQSGGCCEGSSPLCINEGELPIGPNDLLLGHLEGTPFYIDADQDERWNHPSFQLDISDGPTDSFSLESLDGMHFSTRTVTARRHRSTRCKR